MFILNGIMGFPVAAWGFFAVPDLPHNTRAFYFSAEDREYGLQRMEKIGRRPTPKITLKSIWKLFTNWRLWLFILPYNFVGQAISGVKYFNLYLKWDGFSVVHTNLLPTAGDALSVVAALAFGIAADQTGYNAVLIIIVQGLVIVSNIILSVWYVPRGALLFAYFLSYAGLAAQPIVIVSIILCRVVRDWLMCHNRVGEVIWLQQILCFDKCLWHAEM